MARIALVESHFCNWEASGCAIRSFLVCFSYDFKAALKMASKLEEAADVEGVWDIVEVATVEESVGTRKVNTGMMWYKQWYRSQSD